MPSPADQVGSGITRVKRPKPVKLPITQDTPLSAAGDWSDTPEIDNQIQEPSAYKLGKKEIIVLDLSLPQDLKRYNEILTNEASPAASMAIVAKDEKFVEELQNWKVLLTVQHVKFKRLLKKGIKPANVEAQEERQRDV
jgi:hypothetical protein